MPETWAEVVGAPWTETLGEAKLTFRPLSPDELGAWDRWAQGEHLASVATSLKGLTEEDAESRWREAESFVSRLTLGSPRSFGAMLSSQGKLKLLQLAALAHHPSLSTSELWSLLKTMAALHKLWRKLLVLSGLVPEGKAETDPHSAVLEVARSIQL